ncbi:RnfABCDGE type electron transport complex subunit G [Chlamydiota bacterium]
MKEFHKLTISLSTTCLIAAAAIAFVFMITKKPIANQHRLETLKAVKLALPVCDNDPVNDKKTLRINNKDMEFYIGKKTGVVNGIAFESSGEGYAGMIKIMVGINPIGEITGLEILENQETPGLGTRITKSKFKGQYIGKSFDNSKLVKGELAVNKDGGDIDAITGATISSRGVTSAVNKALEIFEKYKEDIL